MWSQKLIHLYSSTYVCCCQSHCLQSSANPTHVISRSLAQDLPDMRLNLTPTRMVLQRPRPGSSIYFLRLATPVVLLPIERGLTCLQQHGESRSSRKLCCSPPTCLFHYFVRKTESEQVSLQASADALDCFRSHIICSI